MQGPLYDWARAIKYIIECQRSSAVLVHTPHSTSMKYGLDAKTEV